MTVCCAVVFGLSAALGAAGSFATHPGQAEVLNRVFMPSDQQLQEAQEILALAEKTSRSGEFITTRNGTMIDAPIVARARAVLSLGH